MLLFLGLWMALLGFHDVIPFANDISHAVEGVIGDVPTPEMQATGEDGMDPLIAAAAALPYWAVLKLAIRLLLDAGKAGQGRDGEKDWTDDL